MADTTGSKQSCFANVKITRHTHSLLNEWFNKNISLLMTPDSGLRTGAGLVTVSCCVPSVRAGTDDGAVLAEDGHHHTVPHCTVTMILSTLVAMIQCDLV